jgi:hypothetical protein
LDTPNKRQNGATIYLQYEQDEKLDSHHNLSGWKKLQVLATISKHVRACSKRLLARRDFMDTKEIACGPTVIKFRIILKMKKIAILYMRIS